MDIKDFFESHSEIAIALSGGVDSSVLLFLAKKYAKKVKAYYVRSQFQPAFEYDDALSVAEKANAELGIIEIDVLSDKKTVSNTSERCYYCKKRIFKAVCLAAQNDGFIFCAEGTNASDDIDDRPGFRALKELNVLSPLRICGFTKEKIRLLAKQYQLPVADKPSYACLATRIPEGTQITQELLVKTENAEKELMKLGYKNFRVRYSDGFAKLEFGSRELNLYREIKEETDKLLLKYYDGIYPEIKERTDE